ncbi:MAG: site-specific DNA-methyltransferase [Myxococcota bacterium]|nr:site-specific DNA-methyltransferase [Myxococcota bacterium]
MGRIMHGDCLRVLASMSPRSVDLIMTSPPFGLVRKKDYGNADADEYLDWFRPFAAAFKRVLKDQGSLVIDIGGAWIPGQPTRSLYHFKLLIILCDEFGFHLAQDFYWWNPSRLPTPAEWVTVRRIRVKDAINCVWWLSPSPWPRASNRRVLQPYSPAMRQLLAHGYKPMLRPSGHDISPHFGRDNGAAIPPNLIAIANTESNSAYLRYCKAKGIKSHPARYPAEIPEFFIRMLTDPGDAVVDPFAGSCVTGEVCERLGRKWVCVDTVDEYLRGALGRFQNGQTANGTKTGGQRRRNGANVPEQQALAPGLVDIPSSRGRASPVGNDTYYRVPPPGLMWSSLEDEPLPADGGQKRVLRATGVVRAERPARARAR